MEADAVFLDGGMGEGGGQVLRTALTLSMVTGRSLRMVNIRKKRSRPGLGRQHLTCVSAAAAVSNAEVEGAAKGSEELLFRPGIVRGGRYDFHVGTAGSTLLVFQVLFPALSFAGVEAEVEITGGTHNPKAPPFEFVERVFLPLAGELGFSAEIGLVRHGFHPRGGGCIRARVLPFRGPGELALLDRGALREMRPRVLIADLSREIADREARVLGRALKRSSLPAEIVRLPPGLGPGNAVLLEARYGEARVLFSAFGRKGVRAEAVAREAVEAWRRFHARDVPVQPELADQLLLPMALAGTGRFRTGPLTGHARTNLRVVEAFFPGRLRVEERGGGTEIAARAG